MQKFFKILAATAFCFFLIGNVSAQIKNITFKNDANEVITVVGFMDYPPVGYIETIIHRSNVDVSEDIYHTVFEDLLKEFSEVTGKKIRYIYGRNEDYEDLIRKVRGGKYDMVLGAYHETKLYEGLDIVFPSLIENPISIITLPQNAGKIKNLAQLKKMKGAISTREHLSDFVSEQTKTYNLEYIDEPEIMFEKLYTGKLDYVFASYFFGIIETSKLGLRNKFSFSKQIIWNMPLFIGVSKVSPNRNYLVGKLTSYSEKADSKGKMEKKLREMIRDVELKNRGIIAPDYTLKSE